MACAAARELPPADLLRTVVFRQTQEGYHTYRIPSLVQASDGALIAIVEGRRDNSRDPGGGHIDLVYKRSRDGGRTWSPLAVFDKSPEGAGASNPTAVVDRASGRIRVFFNRWEPGRGGRNSRAGTTDNQLWMRFSDDHGATWSEPEDLTRAGRDVARWATTVFGPGSGIQTGRGRLVIPVNGREPLPDSAEVRRGAFALYSDDGGRSWHRGQWLDAPTNENQIVELDDGRLLVDARQDKGQHRWVGESDDGGQRWSAARPGQTATPICASILRYPRRNDASPTASLLLWTGPQGAERRDLVLRVSRDQGRSFPAERLIGPGPAAYSNMALLDGGDVGVLWEGGTEYRYEKVFLTRIPAQAVESLGADDARSRVPDGTRAARASVAPDGPTSGNRRQQRSWPLR